METTNVGMKPKPVSETGLSFKEGLKSGVPIAIGYIPIAIAFGLVASTYGVPDMITILMSLMVFAGASQFVGVNLLHAGAQYGEILLTTFILNFRHFLMTAAISQRMETGISKKWMALLSFGITDETFSVASMRNEDRLSRWYLLGLNLIAFSAWNVGTWIGMIVGTGLPDSLQSSMGIALYAMFIGLLIPSMKKYRPVLVTSILAMVIHFVVRLFFAHLSEGWSIILTTIAAAAIATFLFPKGVKSQ